MLAMSTYAPSQEEFALLDRLCIQIRCHRDPNFERPLRTTVRVQERYMLDVNGINLVLEHFAHGLRCLKTRGWFYIFPHSASHSATGALSVMDEDRWNADLIYLKMFLSA